MTRGERNNNPGNIRWGQPWEGLVATSQRTDADFCQFIAPEWGIRAIAKILLSYKSLGVVSILSIINRWAPSSENDTDSYVNDIAQRMGVNPSSPVDVTQYSVMLPLVSAIIMHENGEQIYGNDVLEKGLSLAGVST